MINQLTCSVYAVIDMEYVDISWYIINMQYAHDVSEVPKRTMCQRCVWTYQRVSNMYINDYICIYIYMLYVLYIYIVIIILLLIIIINYY